jgi:hypothetical protein
MDVAHADLPVSSRPRILSRVASAEPWTALPFGLIASTYICLDTYNTEPYSAYIRVSGYKYQGPSIMSDIQQAVREKYGAIATSVRE